MDQSQEQLAGAYQDTDLVTWKQRASQYRNAWEAEKLIAKAALAGQDELLRQLGQEQRGAAFRGALIGALAGLIVGLIIGAQIALH